LQLVAAHRAATTPRTGSPTEPPDSPAPQNFPPGSLAPNYGQHRPYPSRTPLLAPSSTPSLFKHPSKTPLHPIRQPFPLRAFLPVHPHARRGQEGSRSTLLHRWTPPPPAHLANVGPHPPPSLLALPLRPHLPASLIRAPTYKPSPRSLSTSLAHSQKPHLTTGLDPRHEVFTGKSSGLQVPLASPSTGPVLTLVFRAPFPSVTTIT